jgi:hypothetical protein
LGLDLDQARRQAKELLRAAKSGDPSAAARLRGDRTSRLADAQAAVARELGFRSWPALVAGVAGAAGGDGSPLHHAGLWGRANELRLLVAQGADVGALAAPPDQPGAPEWTALDWTAWGSRGTPAAAERQSGYRECVGALLAAGARISDRAPIGHLIDEVRDVGREYMPRRPVRIRVRLRGTAVDVDDLGGAVEVAGMPPGWLSAATRAVTELGGTCGAMASWSCKRRGDGRSSGSSRGRLRHRLPCATQSCSWETIPGVRRSRKSQKRTPGLGPPC